MTFERNYSKRAEDIKETFQLVKFVSEVETHKNIPIVDATTNASLNISIEMQCALKAQFLVVLYNIVESTVCECLNSIYDSIADDSLSYCDLSDEMRNMWKNYLKRTSHPDRSKPDLDLMGMKIQFDSLAVNISGSLDIRKIIEVFSKHGCNLDEANREKYSNSFLVVKNKRNNLAHGNISFSECGSNYLVSDLNRFKEHILDGMSEVVNQVKVFIDNKSYRRV